jgi:hypothetical protein
MHCRLCIGLGSGGGGGYIVTIQGWKGKVLSSRNYSREVFSRWYILIKGQFKVGVEKLGKGKEGELLWMVEPIIKKPFWFGRLKVFFIDIKKAFLKVKTQNYYPSMCRFLAIFLKIFEFELFICFYEITFYFWKALMNSEFHILH